MKNDSTRQRKRRLKEELLWAEEVTAERELFDDSIDYFSQCHNPFSLRTSLMRKLSFLSPLVSHYRRNKYLPRGGNLQKSIGLITLFSFFSEATFTIRKINGYIRRRREKEAKWCNPRVGWSAPPVKHKLPFRRKRLPRSALPSERLFPKRGTFVISNVHTRKQQKGSPWPWH